MASARRPPDQRPTPAGHSGGVGGHHAIAGEMSTLTMLPGSGGGVVRVGDDVRFRREGLVTVTERKGLKKMSGRAWSVPARRTAPPTASSAPDTRSPFPPAWSRATRPLAVSATDPPHSFATCSSRRECRSPRRWCAAWAAESDSSTRHLEYAGLPHPLLTIVAQHHPQPWAPAVLSNLSLSYVEQHSSSTPAAITKLRTWLDAGHPVMCTVNRTALPWHEPGTIDVAADPYPVVVAGIDGDTLYVDDIAERPHEIPTDQFAVAWSGSRKARHPMLAIDAGQRPTPDLGRSAASAVAVTAAHLSGPVLGNSFDVNMGLRGMTKLATELRDRRTKTGWLRRFVAGVSFEFAMRRIVECLQREYTAPDATRPIYADFLAEAAGLLPCGHCWRRSALPPNLGSNGHPSPSRPRTPECRRCQRSSMRSPTTSKRPTTPSQGRSTSSPDDRINSLQPKGCANSGCGYGRGVPSLTTS